MKTIHLLAALSLLATALAIVPSGQAMQTPPPCMSVGGCCGIEPDFAPCCSPVSCPPQPRCPAARVHTSDFLAYLGPHAGVDLRGDCSVQACNDVSGCCTIDGTQSACGTIAQPCEPQSASAVVLPVPHVGYTLNGDCSVTVTETYDCPAGFWNARTHYDAGPVDVGADYCVPMCACMPIEIAGLPQELA